VQVGGVRALCGMAVGELVEHCGGGSDILCARGEGKGSTERFREEENKRGHVKDSIDRFQRPSAKTWD